MNVKTLRALSKKLRKQKNKRGYSASNLSKRMIINNVLQLQEFEDDLPEPPEDLSLLSEEQREKRREARREAQRAEFTRMLRLAVPPDSVEQRLKQYRQLVKYLVQEEPETVFNAGPRPPPAANPDAPRHDEAFRWGWQIDFKKLTPLVFCGYLGTLKAERLSPEQQRLYDSAPRGKKPVFQRNYQAMEVIRGTVNWAATLVGMSFPTPWNQAVRAFLNGVKNTQNEPMAHGCQQLPAEGQRAQADHQTTQQRERLRHLPADLFEAIIIAMGGRSGIDEEDATDIRGATAVAPPPVGGGWCGEVASRTSDIGRFNRTACGRDGRGGSRLAAILQILGDDETEHLLFPIFTPALGALVRQNVASFESWVWPFLLLLWNLMLRGKADGNLVFECLSVEVDGLSIDLNACKTSSPDPAEAQKRNVFANPLQWKQCVFVALGLYLSTWTCNHTTRKRKADAEEQIFKADRLFPGRSTMAMVQHIYRKITKAPRVQRLMKKYGLTPKDVGFHSSRKAVSTVCHYLRLILRAGWGVHVAGTDRKPMEGDDDCMLGRQLAGLPVDELPFATMPPQFKSDVDERLVTKCINETFASVLQHNRMCRNLRPVLRMLLASVMNARDKICREYVGRNGPGGYATLPIFKPEYDVLAASVWAPTPSENHKLPRGIRVSVPTSLLFFFAAESVCFLSTFSTQLFCLVVLPFSPVEFQVMLRGQFCAIDKQNARKPKQRCWR